MMTNCINVKLMLLSYYLMQFAAETTTLKPNIVIIIADDMGRNDVGFLGSEVPTPNIDALAYSGVILDRHYSQSTCTPSRAALLTGKYPSRIGMQGLPLLSAMAYGLNIKEKLMPQYFKELGYSTHFVGKWHLGYYSQKHLPTNRGFDTFFGFHNGFVGYYDAVHYFKNQSGFDAWRNTKKAWPEFYGKYLPTLLDKEAVDIISSHSAQGRKDGLFMIYSSPVPHLGNREFRLEPPPYSHGQRLQNISDEDRRLFADVMIGLDNTVGEIVTVLKQNDMLNNSIIVFFSDNGGAPEDALFHFENHASNWPLKGAKASLHEGGVRTAAAVWSSLFPIGSMTSRINNELFHITDWLPTLYSAAGGSIKNLEGIDGIDQWNGLNSVNKNYLRKEMLLELDDMNAAEAVIKGKWKLIRNYNPSHVLSSFDLYFGRNWSEVIEYNKTEIYNSKVSQSMINYYLDDTIIEQLRAKVKITHLCDSKQQAESMATDCHNKYCLYDIDADPCECNDVAMFHQPIVKELHLILDRHRQRLVKKLNFFQDKRGFPDISNYWKPWAEDSSSAGTNKFKMYLLLLKFYVLKYFYLDI